MNEPIPTISPETAARADLARRRLLYGGVAAGAALAGAGWAWWRYQPHALSTQAAEVSFFEQTFETPAGAPLKAEDFRGKPLLLNFWATWCPPCIAELPMLSEFFVAQQARGWQVLGLAVDQPAAVRKFLERSPVSFPIAMAGAEGTQLSRSLGNLVGGLPFTVVFGADGSVQQRKMGEIKPRDLVDWVAKIT